MSAVLQPEGIQISREEVARRRKAMDADVWLFIKWICGHGADDIARFHRPMAYFLAGDAVRLAACLNRYESEVVTQIRADLVRRGVDWNTAAGVQRLRKLLERVNNRVSRSMGKSIILRDVLLHAASVDPNIDILLTSKSDDAAWGMCEAIGNIMRGEAYARYYPDRISEREDWITKKWIRMAGRTQAEQDTIEARGINSQSYGKHYNIIACDDLSSTEAKQGVATVEDALRFIASLVGISKADRWGGSRYVFCGTIQGPRDDHAEILNNPEYISIVVPIWRPKFGVKWTMKNMMEDGDPVLPELYDLPKCKEKRADTIANDSRGLGKISYLQNLLLCAHEVGAMRFTAELLRNQYFRRIYVKDSPLGWHIRRYLYDRDAAGNSVPKRSLTQRASVECGCYRNCKLKDHAYVQFDPLSLPRNLGVDQAISESGAGDDWGVGVVAVDQFGHKYQLQGAYDKHYWKMIAAIQLTFNKYGGQMNPPQKIAIESNIWQRLTSDWMKREETFRYLAGSIVKVASTHVAKVARIYNDVYSALEDETLWIDPEDPIFHNCAQRYDAAAPDKQWDDPLDCVAMAIQAHRYVPSAMDDKELSRFAEEQAAALAGQSDVASWIDNSTSLYLDARWMN